MIQYRKILELHFKKVSQRTISTSVGSSRNTVSEVIKRAEKLGLESLIDTMNNHQLEEFLFPEKQAIEKGYFPPDWEKIHKELQKKNVTLKLLHIEYAQYARNGGKVPYAYRTFAEKYGKYAKKYKATMPIIRKPGEVLEIDWAGSTLSINDRQTGGKLTVYVFVATFPYSQYSYVEGFLDMKSANWLTGHIHAFEYFDGVPESLVPDNLKTGVIKAIRGEPILNEAYRELADYYQTVIVPGRVRSPKDKSSVEGTVGFISRQIIAALRHYQCFDIGDLNNQILNKLNEINQESFQKRPGSRKKAFDEEEKAYLNPLRQTRFKLSEWRIAKVQSNYHIQIERMYYSIPYEYIQSDVDIRLSKDLLEVYFKEVRITSHKRLFGEIGQFSTLSDHMPDNHRLYLEHTPDNSREWAQTIGSNMEKFVEILLQNGSEKRALNQLMSLRSLEKRHLKEDLNLAAQNLLLASTNPTVSVFKTILARNKKRDKAKDDGSLTDIKTSGNYEFVRGANYFGGNRK
ncbi:IS21 family transposase [Carnobacterium sp. ISL-102]|uniref:IS21 family transposase n=1 Tax=Carnobacterium sp. ISL-102 TaxID=2819142 RepID=UPI001BE50167|nr:IS21 family transposase [Carnobacterium sp. ISL-102]MBT2733157.1 IS21 family transposase [Carnobacterium sp. ISL-102]